MSKFPKKQKLCNKKSIERLFSNSNTFFENPFRIIWKYEQNKDAVAIKSIIVIPQKRLNLAVERNVVKRRIKESYRLHKYSLECYLNEIHKKISIGIIYQQEKILDFTYLDEKIKLILKRLKEEL